MLSAYNFSLLVGRRNAISNLRAGSRFLQHLLLCFRKKAITPPVDGLAPMGTNLDGSQDWHRPPRYEAIPEGEILNDAQRVFVDPQTQRTFKSLSDAWQNWNNDYARERKKLKEQIATTSDAEVKSKLAKRLEQVEKQIRMLSLL